MRRDRPDEALRLITAMIDGSPSPDSETLFMLGKIYWRLGRRAEATSAYAAAAALDRDPDSPPALALRQAREVERFFNPDLLNP